MNNINQIFLTRSQIIGLGLNQPLFSCWIAGNLMSAGLPAKLNKSADLTVKKRR
jgi:hypothetical protein